MRSRPRYLLILAAAVVSCIVWVGAKDGVIGRAKSPVDPSKAVLPREEVLKSIQDKDAKEAYLHVMEVADKVRHQFLEQTWGKRPVPDGVHVTGTGIAFDQGEGDEVLSVRYIAGLSSVNGHDKTGAGYDLHFHENGVVSSFLEFRKNALHGVWMSFYPNGLPEKFADCADNMARKTINWDANGIVREAHTYDPPQPIKFNIGPPKARESDAPTSATAQGTRDQPFGE